MTPQKLKILSRFASRRHLGSAKAAVIKANERTLRWYESVKVDAKETLSEFPYHTCGKFVTLVPSPWI